MTSTDTIAGSISERMAGYIKNLRFSDIPSTVVDKAILHIIDTFGVAVASRDLEIVKPLLHLVMDEGGSEDCVLFGHNRRVPMANAAMFNAASTAALDFDDKHLSSSIHLSCTVVTTALTVGQKYHITGKELLTAIIAGYEIEARLGMAAPWKFHDRGLHPTSIFGAIGSNIVASRIMGLNEREMANSLGLACSMAAGLMEYVKYGSWVKPLQIGWAVHAGIWAARLAASGYIAPPTAFEGRNGLFESHLHGDNYDIVAQLKSLGSEWQTLGMSIKPYPSCHSTHSSIDAVIDIIREHGLSPTDVLSITTLVPRKAYNLCCVPRDEKLRPSNWYSAKYSIPYTVSVAAHKMNVTLPDFTDKSIKRQEMLDFARKVECIYDSNYDRFAASPFIPSKTVLKTPGATYEREVMAHKGTPPNPMTVDEVITKFRSNTNEVYTADVQNAIVDLILHLPSHDMDELTATIHP